MDKLTPLIKPFKNFLQQIRSAKKYPTLTRWILNPPTQEYVLPSLFKHTPYFKFKRLQYNADLALYARYFNPSALVENTMRRYFMEYHSRLIPQATPPPWFDVRAKQSELFPYSQVIEALLDEQADALSPKRSVPVVNPSFDYEHEYKEMLVYAYKLLHAKYTRENPELIPLLDKEKEYIMKNVNFSRDEKRALETIRRQKLHDRIQELLSGGIITNQEALIALLLESTDSCYSFYKLLKDHIAQSNEASIVKIFDAFEFPKLDVNEKLAMPADAQFDMKFDELYDVVLKDEKPPYELHQQEVTSNL